MASSKKTVMDREQYVVKANELIRRSRYSLTTQQQKIVLFAISKIKPDDTSNTVYTIDLDEFCRACGFAYEDGGYYYRSLKDNLNALTRREWCTMPDGTEQTMSWIGDCKINYNSSKVEIRFNPHMEPFLFGLRQNYTQYKLQNVLVFGNRYAIRLYEILRSHVTQKQLETHQTQIVKYSLDELRNVLCVANYPRWADFDRRVLRDAISEINERCDDIHIDYEPRKNGGRSIESVEFVINAPSRLQATIAHYKRVNKLG